jgi:ABC-2 type transport system ATP-binding protein
MITIKNLSFSFGKTKIYDNFNLQVPQGQACLVTGINGVGKSTLLRLIAGVLEPDSGEIIFDAKMGDNPKRKLGFISDRLSIYESLTVARSIELHRSVYGSKTFDDSLIRHTKIRQEQKVKELSVGQRTILMLSLIMSAEPEVLLVDEVIHAMDAYLRKYFLEQLIDLLSHRRVTVLMVNVNFHDIEHMVDRIIMLKDGKVEVDEPIDMLKEKVKKVVCKELPKHIPVIFQSGLPDYPDYFIYPFKEEYREELDAEVVELNLTDIVAAFIGGEYV